MSLPISFHSDAVAEMADAYRWYEEQRTGLGEEFLWAVREVLIAIAANPLMFQVAHKDKRRATARRFPYSIIYRAEQERIVIIAVFHGRRNPNLWRRR